jgi:integrase
VNAGGQIKKGWAGACQRAGIQDATPHTLRHTFASWLVQRGEPLRTVGELLGHRDPSMVMRYSHLSPDHLASAVEGLVGHGAGGPLTKARK